ncbi:hypothetical protein Gotur_029292 [Gossypium turneri]
MLAFFLFSFISIGDEDIKIFCYYLQRNRRLNTPDLLDQLHVLRELLHHLLNCKIAGESVKLYIAITDGILNLIDKYFGMQHHHAVRALEIYRKAGEHVEFSAAKGSFCLFCVFPDVHNLDPFCSF